MRPIRLFGPAVLLVLGPASACLGIAGARFDEARLVEACYEGPAGTEGVGVCRAGEQTFSAEGTPAGACEGQVLPGVECGVDDVDEDCDGRTGAPLWSRALSGNSLQRIQATALFGDGSVVVTGYALGPLVAGDTVAGPGTIVIKLGPDGEIAWARTFGPPDGSAGTSIAVDASGDVLFVVDTGLPVDFGGGVLDPGPGTNRDMLVKLDGEDGRHVWSQVIGGTVADTEKSQVEVRGDGNIVVTGTFLGTLDWPDGEPVATEGQSFHMFASVLDSGGKHLFSAGHGPGVSPRRVAIGPDDEVVVVGVADPGGGVGLGGAPLASRLPTSFVAKLDADLHHVWSRPLGTGTEVNFGRGVAVQPDGTVGVAIPYHGVLRAGATELTAVNLDAGVVALAPSGEPLWARSFGGPGLDAAWSIAAAEEGGWVVGGTFQGPVDVGLCEAKSAWDFDAFLFKVDADGGSVWIHTFGDPYSDEDGFDDGWPAEIVADVEVAPGGEVIAAGEYNGAVDWGGGPLPAVNAEEGFVARFAP